MIARTGRAATLDTAQVGGYPQPFMNDPEVTVPPTRTTPLSPPLPLPLSLPLTLTLTLPLTLPLTLWLTLSLSLILPCAAVYASAVGLQARPRSDSL